MRYFLLVIVLVMAQSVLAAPPPGSPKTHPTAHLPVSKIPLSFSLEEIPLKATAKGHYNLKNGKVIQGTIKFITSRGVLIKIKGAKKNSRIPLYYMFPYELSRDSATLNNYLTKANEVSPAFYHGYCFFHGYGMQANIPLALKYFEYAATVNRYLPAAQYLQWIYQAGDGGVTSNFTAAAKWGRTVQNIITNKATQIAAAQKASQQQSSPTPKSTPPATAKTPSTSAGTHTGPSLQGIGLIGVYINENTPSWRITLWENNVVKFEKENSIVRKYQKKKQGGEEFILAFSSVFHIRPNGDLLMIGDHNKDEMTLYPEAKHEVWGKTDNPQTTASSTPPPLIGRDLLGTYVAGASEILIYGNFIGEQRVSGRSRKGKWTFLPRNSLKLPLLGLKSGERILLLNTIFEVMPNGDLKDNETKTIFREK